MSIGRNIKNLRLKHGLSQKELAEIAGVTDKAVSTWELDKKDPRMGAIQRMADYFGIKKSDIIEPIQVTMDFDTKRSIKNKNSFSDEELKLIDNYRELNDDDKSFVNGMIGRLAVGKTVSVTNNVRNNKNVNNFMNVETVIAT